jgi:L-ribulokinase
VDPALRRQARASGSSPRHSTAGGRPRGLRPTERWVEAADWIVWQMCGVYLRAWHHGYKARSGRTYPSPAYFAALNPAFELHRREGRPADRPARRLPGPHPGDGRTDGPARWHAVCVGNVDAHVTAPAAQSAPASSWRSWAPPPATS